MIEVFGWTKSCFGPPTCSWCGLPVHIGGRLQCNAQWMDKPQSACPAVCAPAGWASCSSAAWGTRGTRGRSRSPAGSWWDTPGSRCVRRACPGAGWAAAGRCDIQGHRPPRLCRGTRGSPPAGGCGHMPHRGQGAATRAQSQKEKEAAPMLRPFQQLLQAVRSPPGYSHGFRMSWRIQWGGYWQHLWGSMGEK